LDRQPTKEDDHVAAESLTRERRVAFHLPMNF
jgi:hypothetical protein